MDDNEISILALTETWIRSDDPPVIKNGPAPPGYRILHVRRDSNQPAGSDQTWGGGLALVYQDGIQISPHKHQTIHTSFELQLVNICSPGRDFVLANIYRPPSASKSTFLVEFANLLTTLGIDAVNRLIICGDFNLPGNSPNTIDDELTKLLHSTSFAQFVDAPTRYDTHHDKWSLLDLVISSSTSFLTSPISVTSSHEISDHSLLLANLSTRRQKPPRRSYQYRNLKDIDLTSFQQQILASSLFTNPNPTVDGFEQQMENTIISILNDFAPLKTGHRSGPRQTKNWLSPEAVEAKKCRLRLERRWKTSNAEPDRLACRAACRTANELIMKSRAASNLERINSCSKNPKSLWTTIKSILHSSTPAEQLPPAVSKPLADSLASFFREKIVALKLAISSKLGGPPSPFAFDKSHTGQKLNDFTPVTPAEVTKLLNSMSSKSSPLDYVSTSLLKSCASTFSILISHLANLSFDQAAFPSKFKHALITPFLKKPGLSKSDPSNFKPGFIHT